MGCDSCYWFVLVALEFKFMIYGLWCCFAGLVFVFWFVSYGFGVKFLFFCLCAWLSIFECWLLLLDDRLRFRVCVAGSCFRLVLLMFDFLSLIC